MIYTKCRKMENKKSHNFYYFLFFIGYFLSIDLGEKRNPKDSGLYFVMIISLGVGISFLFILKFFGLSFNNNFAILSVAGIVAGINYLVFTNSFMKQKLPIYSYIGGDDYRVKRKVIGVLIFVAFLMLTVGSALINNENIKRYLTE